MESLEQRGFEPVLQNVPITGTNHSKWYQDHWEELLVGRQLKLARIKHNDHDPYAVRVVESRPASAHDLGWVGMRTDHSERVARIMDERGLRDGVIVVTTRRSNGHDPQTRMYGTVWLEKAQVAKGLPKKPVRINLTDSPRVTEIFVDGGGAKADLGKHNGKLLHLHTNDARVSVTLQDDRGVTVGWDRKVAFPDAEDVGGKVALVVNRSTVCIISKGDAITNGCKFLEPSVKAEEELFDAEADGQVLVGWRQAGKTTEASNRLKKLLFIPQQLQVQMHRDRRFWMISDDNEHWLHLVDTVADAQALDNARIYAYENYRRHYTDQGAIETLEKMIQEASPKQETQTQTEKETTMNMLNRTSVATILSTNKQAATSAAYLEAGRLANNAFSSFAKAKAPFMVKGYIDTPVGKLVLANIAVIAQRELRPNDDKLAKLTAAMATQAFLEIYQDFDIEGVLANLLDSAEVKRAFNKLDASEAAGTTTKD